MFDWRKEVRRYERILRKEFPRECPVCNEKMKSGYLYGILTKWIQKDIKKRRLVDPVLMPDMRFHRYAWAFSVMPGYDCANCGLIMAKYKPSHRGEVVPLFKNIKNLECCPYCHREMRSGRIYSARGTWWCERMGRFGFMIGNRKMIEPFPWLKVVGVATRRCNECGIIFSKYTPQTRDYFLKLIAMILLLTTPIFLFIFFFLE